jgi:decaprenylphospho-beta-D-ribofuranose 2-oxidase
MTQVSGWGRFPTAESKVLQVTSQSRLNTIVHENHQLIARGLGRSYGDSSLATVMASLEHLDCIVDFNVETGVITCDAGCTFQYLEQFLVPHGWFLPVVPGTWFVTVGGAIASDIHGKNHHVSGTFCEHVLSIDVFVGTGEIITCSPDLYKDLYHATCGGMGLTGIVGRATIQLLKIHSSQIQEQKYVASSLEEALALFEQYESSTYTVAWIDCLSKGRNLGRSVLMVGEHFDDQILEIERQGQVGVPFDLPRACMNKLSMSLFNNLYYAAGIATKGTNLKSLTSFFHPLDAIGDWNRCYGALGFIQYQFVIPKSCGPAGLRLLLTKIAESGRGSFLAVLKQFGPANLNLLSFPMEGYTLALDFKLDTSVLELLLELDEMILGLGGKFYLTKDSRMTQNTFFRSTPKLPEFQSIREKYGCLGKFVSKQSIRLGLD